MQCLYCVFHSSACFFVLQATRTWHLAVSGPDVAIIRKHFPDWVDVLAAKGNETLAQNRSSRVWVASFSFELPSLLIASVVNLLSCWVTGYGGVEVIRNSTCGWSMMQCVVNEWTSHSCYQPWTRAYFRELHAVAKAFFLNVLNISSLNMCSCILLQNVDHGFRPKFFDFQSEVGTFNSASANPFSLLVIF